MEIRFSKSELTRYWGPDKVDAYDGDRHNFLLHLVFGGLDDYYQSQKKNIRQHGNEYIVTLTVSQVDDVIDDIFKAYRSIASKILSYDELEEDKNMRKINLGDSSIIYVNNGQVDRYGNEVKYPITKKYGTDNHITRNDILKEYEKIVKQIKSKVLVDGDALGSEIYNIRSYICKRLTPFQSKCHVYNAQRVLDCVEDLHEMALELRDDWKYEEFEVDKKKYLLLWFKAYDVVRQLYIDFVYDAQQTKGLAHDDYPSGKLYDYYNLSINRWMFIEHMHNEHWEWILDTIKDTSVEKINSAKNINHKAYERWNAQESQRLLAMYEEGVNVNSIAKTFNRSLTSVIIQLGKLLSEELRHNANS